MKYEEVRLAKFMERQNRFIADCRLLETDEPVRVHVKNTGRCKELLLPGVTVALSYQPGPKRKTAYDLVAVQKRDIWINIDSQLPNRLVGAGLKNGIIKLPKVKGALTLIKAEQTFLHSKFDFYLETDQQEKIFIEVKGMTLEHQQLAAFPDAPTLRGLKHVQELQEAQKLGYLCYVLFVVQFEAVRQTTIHEVMQPALAAAVSQAQALGVQVLAYNCQVTAATVNLKGPVPFDLAVEFEDPNN